MGKTLCGSKSGPKSFDLKLYFIDPLTFISSSVAKTSRKNTMMAPCIFCHQHKDGGALRGKTTAEQEVHETHHPTAIQSTKVTNAGAKIYVLIRIIGC